MIPKKEIKKEVYQMFLTIDERYLVEMNQFVEMNGDINTIIETGDRDLNEEATVYFKNLMQLKTDLKALEHIRKVRTAIRGLRNNYGIDVNINTMKYTCTDGKEMNCSFKDDEDLIKYYKELTNENIFLSGKTIKD